MQKKSRAVTNDELRYRTGHNSIYDPNFSPTYLTYKTTGKILAYEQNGRKTTQNRYHIKNFQKLPKTSKNRNQTTTTTKRKNQDHARTIMQKNDKSKPKTTERKNAHAEHKQSKKTTPKTLTAFWLLSFRSFSSNFAHFFLLLLHINLTKFFFRPQNCARPIKLENVNSGWLANLPTVQKNYGHRPRSGTPDTKLVSEILQ